MNSTKRTSVLQKAICLLKKDLKDWETEFTQKHKRSPAIKDIAARPSIEKYYRKYNKMKAELKEILKKKQSSTTENQNQNVDPLANGDSQESTQDLTYDISTEQFRNSLQSSSSQAENMNTVTTYDRDHKVTTVHPFDVDDVVRVNEPNSQASSQRSVVDVFTEEIMNSSQYVVSSDTCTKRLDSPGSSYKRESKVTTTTLSIFDELRALPLTQGGITEDEFWLSASPSQSSNTFTRPIPRGYSSQPLPTKDESLEKRQESKKANTQEPKKRSIFSGPVLIPKKHSALDDCNKPYLRRQRLRDMAKQKNKGLPEQTTSAKKPVSKRRSPPEPIIFEDEGDDVIEIEEHVVDPFKNYDPSLFRWDDPNFSVGRGFFVSNKVYASFGVPFLNEPLRRERVLKKLEKGTLGEPIPENFAMEEDIPDDVREFIKQNTIDINKPVKFLSQSIKERRKNPRRQTKLFKLKFVEV